MGRTTTGCSIQNSAKALELFHESCTCGAQNWLDHYGGIDTPERRSGYRPAGFKSMENPFYFALPYGEFTAAGKLKRRARLLKNRWIEIVLRGRSCFAQWQDVGPCGEDDFGFVFGNSAKPRNTFDARAGLDVSPAVWHYLGMDDNRATAWRFVEADDVPPGPWTEIVTISGTNR